MKHGKGEAGLTRLHWGNKSEKRDPGRVQRDPRDQSRPRQLEELVQLASIYEGAAKRIQSKADQGHCLSAAEQAYLAYFHDLCEQINRMPGQ